MPTLPAKHKRNTLPQQPRPCAKAQDRRESSTKRGYGKDWQDLRDLILATAPLCVHCAARAEYTTATTVDHIIPFKGRYDPKRLDEDNLQPLCQPCHDRKSWKDGTKAHLIGRRRR